ncbi:kinase-like domain-containing protein [Xylaria nigripes]|nr:kinase-like domain-containing protein [Xylaria nigripes]
MSVTGSPPENQLLRNRLFARFVNYRQGLSFSHPVSRSFNPVSGDVPPSVYVPIHPDFRQFKYVLQQHRINLDDVRDLTGFDQLRDLLGFDASIVQASDALQRLKSHFAAKRRHGKTFKYQRCLGWGGNGLAAAFDVVDENDQKDRSVVVKMMLKDGTDAAKFEVNALKKHARSEHIVQLLYVDGEGLIDNTGMSEADEDTTANSPDAPKHASNPPTTIILELAENGDLAQFIAKVRAHNETIPNRVLWRLLLCLIRMCIGLAYPPGRINQYRNVPGPITETVLDGLVQYPQRIVHFDIDPKNVFVGDLVGKEHKLTPLLKLGDFGMATEIRADQADLYYERRRAWGKYGFYAPEQFCADWDYIYRGWDLISTHPIAGNYHWHTNVWGVGLIMECLVTLCHPLIPPYPQKATIMPPQGKEKYWSYGAHLSPKKYRHVDPGILSVIQRCQANMPADRPSLQALESFVVSNIDKAYPGESDDMVQFWMYKILNEPVPLRPIFQPPKPEASESASSPFLTLGSGPTNPPPALGFPQQGVGLQLPPGLPRPRNAQAPGPRDPMAPSATYLESLSPDMSFSMRDS